MEREQKELRAAQERLQAREETLQLEKASVEGVVCNYVAYIIYPALYITLNTEFEAQRRKWPPFHRKSLLS